MTTTKLYTSDFVGIKRTISMRRFKKDHLNVIVILSIQNKCSNLLLIWTSDLYKSDWKLLFSSQTGMSGHVSSGLHLMAHHPIHKMAMQT